eukprot:CAMPEP_0117446640 /NCGR_PEP_ID=MMETSP0759-20121206/6454_1 /TAXON_ID=63605 /ORGANISM="Percolomonas cosmopolitus, Strain WS" /LENGTH=221 /DNA_ID=CAMNT_0005238931 /DNA_START=100 /DNA_END=765 /DNA_ORIENTATION=-
MSTSSPVLTRANLLKYAPIAITSSVFLYSIYLRYIKTRTPPLNGKQGIVKNCATLNDAFKRFTEIISRSNDEVHPSEYFFGNWLIISSTIFDKDDLIAAALESKENNDAIQCVLQFMGFRVTGHTHSDLTNLKNSDYSFDDDQFTENVFNVIDCDNNGYIDKEELGVAVRDLKLFKGGETNVEKLFAEMDLDGQGVISLDEFQKWWEQHFDEENFCADAEE